MTRFNHQPVTNHCLNRHSYLSLQLSDQWCRIPCCGCVLRSATRDPTVSPEGEWTVQLQLGLQTYMCPRHRSAMVSYPSLQSLGPPMPDLAFPWAWTLRVYAAASHLAPNQQSWRPNQPDMELRELDPSSRGLSLLLLHESRWIYTAACTLISLLLLRDKSELVADY